MRKWSNAFALIIVLIFVQAITSCGYFSPENSDGEPDSATTAPVVIVESTGESQETATAAPSPSEESPTAEPSPTPLGEAEILTNISEAGEPAPRLIGRNPAGADTLGLSESLELYFDQPMQPDATSNAFKFTDSSGASIAGTVEWPQPRVLRFTPETVLTTGSQYNVILAQSAAAASGMTLVEAVSLDLFTIDDLEVSSVSPANNVDEVASDSAITVIFSRPVVPLVNAEAQDSLPSPIILSPPSPGTGEWVNTSVYIWRPSVPLVGNATYQVTASAAIVNEISASGAQLPADFSWSFSVTAPTLNNLSVPGVFRNVDQTINNFPTAPRAFILTFNQPMDDVSTRNAVSLTQDNGTQIPFEFSWNAIKTALTFTATRSLEIDTNYTFTLQADAVSAAGGRLRNGKTVDINTIKFPSLSHTEPSDGSTQSRFSSGFDIFFTTEMDRESLKEKVVINPPITGDPNGQYNNWRDSLTFWGLSPATNYTVTILPGMADPYGNTLAETRTFTFRTANRDPFAALEMNYPFALYRYNGNSAAWVRHINAENIQLNVYELNDFRKFFGFIESYNNNNYDPISDNFLQTETVNGEPGSNKTKYTRFNLKDSNGNMHPHGFYYVTLNAAGVAKAEDRYNDARPIIIANANLTLKTTDTEAFVWLTSLESGAPIGGQEVILYNKNFDIVSRATTDASGIASMTGLTLDTGWQASYYAIVDSDTTTAAAITGWDEGVSPWEFGINTNYSSGNDLRGYIYTDRPLYRPDQTVFIKGVIRSDNDLNYTIPDVEEVVVEVYSFEGEVFKTTVTPNTMGSFELELELDSEAVLGDYSIQAHYGEQENERWIGSGTFSVAEYRKPTFQVHVDGSANNIVEGGTFTADINAEFFSGGGVSNSTLEWSLTTQDTTFRPSDLNLSRYSFSTVERDRNFYFDPYNDYSYGTTIASGKGVTNRSGDFALELPAEVDSEDGTRRMTLEAVVTDLAGNVVAGRTTYTIHPGSQYAGIKSSQYIGEVGKAMGLDLVVVDLDGQILPGAIVDIEIVKRNWFSVQEDDGEGGLIWKSTVEEVPVADISGLAMNETGRGLAEFIPENGGTYRAYASTTDASGNKIVTSTFFWVSGGSYVPWRRINDHSFELIADADSYVPGDRAKLLIASPFQGVSYALVTLERGSVYESTVIPLTSNSTIYELPITPQMAPNVYVSVMIMKGVDEFSDHPDFKVGYAQLLVDPGQQELNIDIVPDREKLGPSETVRYEITVTDANGSPVEAELSLALVDLALLSLKKEQIPSMLDYFYVHQSLSVSTALLLTKEMDSFNAEIEEKAKGGGGGGGGGDQGVTAVRELFKDTAHWTAILKTDANGKASAEITLPDNLTTWRLDARAITADTKVGQATNDIVSTRPLLVSPQTPRFFIVGDQLTIGTVVRNTTGNSISANVSISAVGLDLNGPSSQLVEIEAEGQAFVTWAATVQDTKRVDLIFQAEGGGFSDASRPTLGTLDNQGIPVYKYEIFETVGTSGQMLEGGVIVESIGLPVYSESDYVPTQGDFTIELAPSLAAAMTTGLDYLEHYEYECTEQVVSKFLPNVLTTRAMREAGVSNPQLVADLETQVNVALQKIYARQRPNGGWAWWDDPKSETNILVASYVVLSLIEADEAGYNVRPEVITNGMGYLRSKVAQADGLNARTKANRQAFVAYVMARGEQPDPNLVEQLFEQRENMDLYARAYLARAMHLVDPTDPRLETLKADFTSAATFSATGTHWEEPNGNDYQNWNTNTRTTAIVMGTMAQLDSENPLVANSVRWLMNHRTHGRWGGTQTTAWTLMALTDWMVESGELNANYDFEVALNGELIGRGSGNQDTLRDTTEIVRDITTLDQSELNKLAIGRTAGEGNLYYTAYMKVGLPVDQIKARDDGIVISRSYFNPDDPTEPITEAVVGDTVMVRLSIVAPRYLHYVGIADWLPAGLEPIDTSLETSIQNDPVNEEQGGARTDFEPSYYNYASRGYGWWYFQHIQLRDEKVELSAQYLPKGTYEYVYLARAATPGTFNVIPPQAEQFYHPEVSGRGAGMKFVIHPVGTTLTSQKAAADPIRIQFAPGAIAGEIDGYVRSSESPMYMLGASAGQTMSVEVISPNSDVAFTLQAPDGSSLGSASTVKPLLIHELSTDGDYTIVLTTLGAGTGYLLRVTIE